MREIDLTEPCSGPCNGYGYIVLVGLSSAELDRWEKHFPNYGIFKNGKQKCPVCLGRKVLIMSDLQLEKVKGEG